MTHQNTGGADRPVALALSELRRRRRRGGRQRALPPSPAPPLSISPTPDAITTASLRLLATERALLDIIRVLAPVAAVDPHTQCWLASAQALKRRVRHELTTLGFGPEATLDAEDRVEIAGRVYRLPDQFDATARELLQLTMAPSATLTQQETTTMNTATHDPNSLLNGTTAPAQPGFVMRTIAAARATLPAMRWPTITEMLIGAAVVIVAGGVYVACTGEVPTEA